MVRCELSISIDDLGMRRYGKGFFRKTSRSLDPVERTTCPAGLNSICMGGSGSGTSCQLFSCSTEPRSTPRPIVSAFFHPPPESEPGTFQFQSIAAPSMRSAGSDT